MSRPTDALRAAIETLRVAHEQLLDAFEALLDAERIDAQTAAAAAGALHAADRAWRAARIDADIAFSTALASQGSLP